MAGLSPAIYVFSVTTKLFFGCALVTLRGMIARPAVTAPAAMQREAVGLALIAVAVLPILTVRALMVLRRILLRLLRSLAAGNERRQTIDIFVVVLLKVLLRPRLIVLLLRLLWLEILLLRLLLWIERLLLRCRRVRLAAHVRLIVTLVVKGVIAAAVRAAGLSRLLLVVRRLVLPQVLLRGGNQTKIMLGVLVVVFGGNRIAGALRVARELKIFFGNVRGVTPDLHVRSVGLIHAGQWILVVMMMVATFTAVATPHALILTVSHDFLFTNPCC
jgi:hypothetical protein